MTAERVSQLAVSTLGDVTAAERVSQLPVSVLGNVTAAERVSQLAVIVLYEPNPPVTYPTYSQAETVLPRWEFWLSDAAGNRIMPLSPLSADLLRQVNAPDVLSLVLGDGSLDYLDLPELLDLRVAVYRAGLGVQIPRLENEFFIRHPRYQNKTTALIGYGPLELLKRRIVAYAAGSVEADQADYADDMIKVIVRQNLGTGATAARQISGLTVTVDQSLAPSITKSFARRNVLDICREIAEVSYNRGTPLYFDMVKAGTGWIFQTFTQQRGTDRRSVAGYNPVILSEENENMQLVSLDYDAEDERNYIYVGGQGTESSRTVREVTSDDQYNSIWNRREGFRDARQEDTNAGLDAAGYDELNKQRALINFVANVQETPQFRYGVDWDFGDYLTASYRGERYDVRVNSVRLSIDSDGHEQITAQVRT